MYAIRSYYEARHFDVTPRVAMLSFSNFGSVQHPLTLKVKKATELVKEWAPELTVDGEIQANVALDPEIVKNQYPFSNLKGDANVFIFPDLQSGNITYKMLAKLGNAVAVGPILMGRITSYNVCYTKLLRGLGRRARLIFNSTFPNPNKIITARNEIV